jgi:hypothetical protein
MQGLTGKAIFYAVQNTKWTEIKIGRNLGRKWDCIRSSLQEGSVDGIKLKWSQERVVFKMKCESADEMKKKVEHEKLEANDKLRI